jgi:hypothetical protein
MTTLQESPKASVKSSSSVGLPDVLSGWDTFLAAPRASAVRGDKLRGAVSRSAIVRVCKSISDTVDALGVSASLSVSAGPDSGSAKADYLRKLNISEYSLQVIVKAELINRITTNNVQFLPPSSPPTDEGLRDWFLVHGDSYVSEVHLGVEYFGVFVFQTRSLTEQTNLAVSASLSAVADGVSVGANYQQTIDSLQANAQTTSEFSEILLGGTTLEPPSGTPGECANFAYKLLRANVPPGDEVVTSIWTEGYERVPGGGGQLFEPIRKNRLLYAGGNAFAPFGIYYQFVKCSSLQNGLNSIKHLLEVYHYADMEQINKRINAVTEDLAALGHITEELGNDPTRPYNFPHLQSYDWVVPQVEYNTPESDFGATTNEGQMFSDIGNVDIGSVFRLSNIAFNGSNVLEGMTATYTDMSHTPIKYSHGGNGGPTTALDLSRPGTRITKMQATLSRLPFFDLGNYLSSIKIWVNNEATPALSWPPSPWPPYKTIEIDLSHGLVIGINGRDTFWYMQELKPVVIAIKGIDWGKGAGATYAFGVNLVSKTTSLESNV